MSTHVANSRDYEAGFIPQHWVDNEDAIQAEGRYELVWIVDNESGIPVQLSIIDTIDSVYAEADILIVDPADQTTWTAGFTTEDQEWLPCDEG